MHGLRSARADTPQLHDLPSLSLCHGHLTDSDDSGSGYDDEEDEEDVAKIKGKAAASSAGAKRKRAPAASPNPKAAPASGKKAGAASAGKGASSAAAAPADEEDEGEAAPAAAGGGRRCVGRGEHDHDKFAFLKPANLQDAHKRRPDHPDYDPTSLYVPESFVKEATPAMKQWWAFKALNYDCVLLFKMGKVSYGRLLAVSEWSAGSRGVVTVDSDPNVSTAP